MRLQKSIALFILIGSVWAMIAQAEMFPFSHYPMYSMPLTDKTRVDYEQLVGVTFDHQEFTVPVRRAFPPLWRNGFREALMADPNEDVVRTKLRATLRWYTRRSAKDPALPKFQALRIYRYKLTWKRWQEINSQAPVNRTYAESERTLWLEERLQ